jgi:putative FmdB family regulatory protein
VVDGVSRRLAKCVKATQMPIYEFECTNDKCEANLRYEKELSINEDHDVECGLCYQPMRKIYSSFGIQFKGSGFYSTDK